MEKFSKLPTVEGAVSLYNVLADGTWNKLSEESNQIQWSWGQIACHLFGDGNSAYKISAMYIEFENTAFTPSVPSYSRDEGVEYYEGLSLSATRDFIRVPLLAAPSKTLASGYSNIAFNQLNFIAQTSGVQGVHGKTFSDTVSSKVFGLALVAAPAWNDRTKDLIFARKYYSSGSMVTKQASSQIGVSWAERFK
jgi:hypothetical protein